jgi:hypothetical protein
VRAEESEGLFLVGGMAVSYCKTVGRTGACKHETNPGLCLGDQPIYYLGLPGGRRRDWTIQQSHEQ